MTDNDGTSSQLSFGSSTRALTPTTNSRSTSTESSGSSRASSTSSNESTGWSSGLPSLTLRWIPTTKAQAKSLRRVLSDILRASRTTMWDAWDLVWSVEVEGQLVKLHLAARPQAERPFHVEHEEE